MTKIEAFNYEKVKKNPLYERTVHVSDIKEALKLYNLGAEKVILVKEDGRRILLPNPYLN